MRLIGYCFQIVKAKYDRNKGLSLLKGLLDAIIHYHGHDIIRVVETIGYLLSYDTLTNQTLTKAIFGTSSHKNNYSLTEK